ELRMGRLDVGDHRLAAPMAQTKLLPARSRAERNEQIVPAQSIRSVAMSASRHDNSLPRGQYPLGANLVPGQLLRATPAPRQLCTAAQTAPPRNALNLIRSFRYRREHFDDLERRLPHEAAVDAVLLRKLLRHTMTEADCGGILVKSMPYTIDGLRVT